MPEAVDFASLGLLDIHGRPRLSLAREHFLVEGASWIWMFSNPIMSAGGLE
jgi:hypothetical protein